LFCFSWLVFTYHWVKYNGHCRDKCLPSYLSWCLCRSYAFTARGYLDNLSLVFVNAVAGLGERSKPLTRLYRVTRINSTRKREHIPKDGDWTDRW
jgi:hypothetical protein